MGGIFSQFGTFLIIGAITTLLDFAVYNLLTRKPLAWRRIPGSLVSCTVAMTFSFTVNWQLVFRPDTAEWINRALRFLLVTSLSSYGLQSVVIFILSNRWRKPVAMAQAVAGKIPVVCSWGAETVDKNVVKGAAVIAGLLWNFLWYKYFVYA